MAFVPRAVRNVWHEVVGVVTRFVHEDDEETETVDLTDKVTPPSGSVAGIASASFVNVSGVVLSAVTIAGMLLSWLRKETGTATLRVQFNTTVFEVEDYVGDGVQAASVTTGGGNGYPEVVSYAGDKVWVEFSSELAGDEHLGKYLRVKSDENTCLMLLDESLFASGEQYGCTVYGATLLEDLPAALNGSYSEGYASTTVWAFVTPVVVTLGDVINISMAWVDPKSPDTDYTS